VGLTAETIWISACIAVLSAVPIFLEAARRYSRFFFLMGTGALSGILAFDLLPDLFELGGTSSLWGVGVVWLLYSLLHLSHLKHHDHAGEEHSPHAHGGSTMFLASMVAHCMASGMLLVASQGLNQSLSRTVFWALLAHKAYEALTVSSVLLEREKSRARTIASVAAYALSLPAGVALTYSFRAYLTPFVAMLVTSLAAGTLLGCLLFDFLLPSLRRMKKKRIEIAWIVAGLLLTQAVMRAV
jgi:zinc transporter ZupT